MTGDEVARFISGITPSQVQPAGVDLRVSELKVLDSQGILGAESRVVPEGRLVEPVDGWWSLEPGAYRIRFMEVVEVPGDSVGFCYPRSSLARMGAMLGCGVWDPGYRGRGESLLIVFNPYGLRLEVGARVAQLVYARLSRRPGRLYRGAYHGEGI
ncbi:MAG: deoxyuridine 5'-triphosphate nucleotidohydrolase [Desulfurococcales archaeon]|nr:deoxyuridine 5'-triphosphate nucleotidohydrolase [Desulfurococcales archaeon]